MPDYERITIRPEGAKRSRAGDGGLTFASLFAGVGGFDYAFDLAGMTCVSQVEINPQRQTVLNRHWPNLLRGEDVRHVSGTDLGRPDLIAAGFPCKDLSIGKGHRAGLAGERSGLYWEFRRLVDEHLKLVDATRPRWTVLENVPGLSRSNDGRDLAAVLLGLEQLGYGWAFRVVDARQFGAAQRRPRVIVVGHRGGDPRPAWLVLADGEAGNQPPAVRGEPTGPQRSSADRGSADLRVFRKASRPQATAAKGGYSTWRDAGFFNVLTANDAVNVGRNRPTVSAVKQTHLVVQNGRLRALTPIEWERLQGFPDDWTAGIPEAERYYALGDAMNVNMARWLGEKIIQVTEAIPLLRTVA